MKKIITTFFFLGILLTSCQKEDHQTANSVEQNFSQEEIDNFIFSYTDKGVIFDWAFAEASMIHSAAMYSDSLIAIGYQVEGIADIESFIGQQTLLPESWIAKRSEIINTIFEIEKQINPSITQNDIIVFDLDNHVPTLALKISTFESINMLKQRADIRYVEPMGYSPNFVTVRSSSGCGTGNTNINSSDYTAVTPNAKVPWNYYKHNIDKAWNTSTGDNIGICIVDTGASDNQNNLGSQFNSGNSSGRTVQKLSTKYSGWWWWKSLDPPHDQCGHGTSMAGLATGPWSNDGNSVGVAYNSNLLSIRATEDVIVNTSNEKNGVKDALVIVGNRSDMKIASMSIGNIVSSGTVRDGVLYAYNRGKMVVAAAGTSFSWTNWVGVIFPANMSQTIAVTGVKDQNSYKECNTCHYGNKVDFTLKMQRSNNNDRTSLTLELSGNNPRYISGSSCATATFAGVAGLVWATNTGMSRSSVLNKLKVASQNYPSRNSNFGWGNINAEAAVLGLPY